MRYPNRIFSVKYFEFGQNERVNARRGGASGLLIRRVFKSRWGQRELKWVVYCHGFIIIFFSGHLKKQLHIEPYFTFVHNGLLDNIFRACPFFFNFTLRTPVPMGCFWVKSLSIYGNILLYGCSTNYSVKFLSFQLVSWYETLFYLCSLNVYCQNEIGI